MNKKITLSLLLLCVIGMSLNPVSAGKWAHQTDLHITSDNKYMSNLNEIIPSGFFINKPDGSLLDPNDVNDLLYPGASTLDPNSLRYILTMKWHWCDKADNKYDICNNHFEIDEYGKWQPSGYLTLLWNNDVDMMNSNMEWEVRQFAQYNYRSFRFNATFNDLTHPLHVQTDYNGSEYAFYKIKIWNDQKVFVNEQ